MSEPVVGFAGLTHLGLVSAVAAAARGCQAIGYHADDALIAALERGELPMVEPGLLELLGGNRDRLSFSADPAALSRCDVVYVAADVPTDDRGVSDLEPIREITATVTGAIEDDVVLVVLSQVPPGFTRRLSFDPGRLYYQAETLTVGHAVERAMHPERFIVGCADPSAPLPPRLQRFLEVFDCPILAMRYESAELAKVSINMYLVASVTVANTMAELCEKVGADWSEVGPALKLDPRIGPHAYLKPGLGIAGGNLERDLATVCTIAERTGSDAGAVRAWIADSRHRRDWVLRVLHEKVLRERPGARIAVLGLAYKENTASIKNSPALALIEALGPRRVRVFDPMLTPADTPYPELEATRSALEACDGAEALTIMTPAPEFAALRPKEIAERLSGSTVIDPYAVLDPVACQASGLHYRTLGRPAD